MLKKRWTRWMLAGGGLLLPAVAFAATQAGDLCCGWFSCPF